MQATAPTSPAPVLPTLLFKAVRLLILILALIESGLIFTPASEAAEVNSQEQAIFNLVQGEPRQNRASLELDPILCAVAQAKAADMAARGYFAHVDPNGRGANTLVRNAGYVLPANYSTALGANNIESLAAGYATVNGVWNDWMNSAPHRMHLLAESDFFAAQTSIGVGFVNAPGSEFQYYWVVITAPPSGPQLTITSPESGTDVNDSFVTVTGTTGGEPTAAAVQVRVENTNGEGPWVAADGVAAWTANVDGLIAGANTLRVQTLAADGTVLRDGVRNIHYAVLSPLTINVTGEGRITRGFAGTTMREAAASYTVTATAKPGSLFAGWTGGVTTLARTITFTLPEGGLTLDARFIPNPFAAGVGAYSGLFTSTDGTRGALSVSLNRNGGFTARLRIGSEKVALKGRFDAAGAAQVSATSKSGATYTLALHYTNDAGEIALSGTISSAGWSADVTLDALSKPSPTQHPNAGRYTLVIAPSEGPDMPAGDSIAIVGVSKTGTASVAGALADGTPFTARGRLTDNGTLQVFVPVYRREGLVTGTLNFRTQAVSDIDGTLSWSRPAQPEAATFPAGFAIEVAAVGSRYTAPANNQPIVPVSSGVNNTSLGLSDGGLAAPVVQPTTLTPSNMLTISAPTVSGLTAMINTRRGDFSGKFVHPQTGTVTTIRGVILQKQGAGFGFFAGGSDAGYATFAPTGVQTALIAE